MDLESAPRPMHEPFTCSLCEEGEYVLYDNDKVCKHCGYISGSASDAEPDHPWFRWRSVRNHLFEKEDGGTDRRMVVGSYIHAYDDWNPN